MFYYYNTITTARASVTVTNTDAAATGATTAIANTAAAVNSSITIATILFVFHFLSKLWLSKN